MNRASMRRTDDEELERVLAERVARIGDSAQWWVARRSRPSSTGQRDRPSSYGVISRAVTNAAARADRDLLKIPIKDRVSKRGLGRSAGGCGWCARAAVAVFVCSATSTGGSSAGHADGSGTGGIDEHGRPIGSVPRGIILPHGPPDVLNGPVLAYFDHAHQ
jgi:hypothetical protein